MTGAAAVNPKTKKTGYLDRGESRAERAVGRCARAGQSTERSAMTSDATRAAFAQLGEIRDHPFNLEVAAQIHAFIHHDLTAVHLFLMREHRPPAGGENGLAFSE